MLDQEDHQTTTSRLRPQDQLLFLLHAAQVILLQVQRLKDPPVQVGHSVLLVQTVLEVLQQKVQGIVLNAI